MARIEKTVFISYRRKDISWALAVYQYLTTQKYDVFFDFSSLSSGDFEQVIISNIKARAHFLLILTPTALDRCDEPGDWLRREIETAVDEQRNIIPLFLDGFSFGLPSVAEKLTGKIGAIKRYNGLDIPSGYFLEAMERLSERYLNVPLDAVIHPVSTEVRKAVKQEQIAVNEAIAKKWEELKELVKPAAEKSGQPDQSVNKKSTGRRRSGIGAGILAILVLGIIGVNALLPNGSGTTTPTATATATDLIVTSRVTTEPAIFSADTVTEKIETPTPTPEPTSTVTSVPTLGVGSTEISPKDEMVLLYVPPGEFRMGFQGGSNELDEKPVHTVNLDAFWIDQTEVTNGMYAKCVDVGKCDLPGSLGLDYYLNPEYENYPVTSVLWDKAKSYCTWAGRRLPTEAEWEKAARGLDQRIYPWKGNKIDCSFANYYDRNKYCFNPHGGPSPVKNYESGKSPYGAYEMAGNVWEWVEDFYLGTYYSISPTLNPTGPETGTLHVARGGAWDVLDVQLRSSNRGNFDSRITIGFRCASGKALP